VECHVQLLAFGEINITGRKEKRFTAETQRAQRKAAGRTPYAFTVEKVALGGEFADGGGEGAGVSRDIVGGGDRGDECHVVEWREEDAAIESVEVHEALELEIGGGRCFATVAWRMRMEEIFGAAA